MKAYWSHWPFYTACPWEWDGIVQQRLKQCVCLTSDKRGETPQSPKASCSVKKVMAQNDLQFPWLKFPSDVWLLCLVPNNFASYKICLCNVWEICWRWRYGTVIHGVLITALLKWFVLCSYKPLSYLLFPEDTSCWAFEQKQGWIMATVTVWYERRKG